MTYNRHIVLLMSVLLVASNLPSIRCYRITLERLDYETDRNGVDTDADADAVVEDNPAGAIIPEPEEAPTSDQLNIAAEILLAENAEKESNDNVVVKRETGSNINYWQNADSSSEDSDIASLSLPEVQEDEAPQVPVPVSDSAAIDTNQAPQTLRFACKFNLWILDPTCGSDGYTYASRYELACAQKQDLSLTIVPCDDPQRPQDDDYEGEPNAAVM